MTLATDHDRHGMLVAHISCSQCDNERANIAHATKGHSDIWQAAEARDTMTIDRYAQLIGGCRTGTDPTTSVIDFDHRVWGTPNLSVRRRVMPTQGAADPALTIMALASRLAERLSAGRAPASRRVAAPG